MACRVVSCRVMSWDVLSCRVVCVFSELDARGRGTGRGHHQDGPGRGGLHSQLLPHVRQRLQRRAIHEERRNHQSPTGGNHARETTREKGCRKYCSPD